MGDEVVQIFSEEFKRDPQTKPAQRKMKHWLDLFSLFVVDDIRIAEEMFDEKMHLLVFEAFKRSIHQKQKINLTGIVVYIYRIMKAESSELLQFIFDNDWCLNNNFTEEADDSTNSDDGCSNLAVSDYEYFVRDLCGLVFENQDIETHPALNKIFDFVVKAVS